MHHENRKDKRPLQKEGYYIRYPYAATASDATTTKCNEKEKIAEYDEFVLLPQNISRVTFCR